MAGLKSRDVQVGEIVLVRDVPSLPDNFEKYIGVELVVDKIKQGNIHCTKPNNENIVLFDGEFKYPEGGKLTYNKQKQKLNL